MIGAIKRRWKSKKAKVLQKGTDLSTSNDTCPASRGFVDEDFEKMVIKPPSPRQVHPVGEMIGNSGHPAQTQSNKKSNSLSSDEACPFIRVNSGRIELVNCGTSGRHSSLTGSPQYHLPHPPTPEVLSEKLKRRLGGRLRNDTRHSWCGASRDGTRRLTSGIVLSPPATESPTSLPVEKPRTEDPTYSDPIEDKEILRLRTSLLQERIDVVESLTRECQTWQKNEAERCMGDLATQVSRTVTLHQHMKSEVEKLQERILELETHNRAMATMIVPTLMKLQDTMGKRRTTVELDSSRETPAKIKGETRESLSPTSTAASPQSLKQKKIDCRIPRMNYRLTKTKQAENSGSGESTSPEPSPRPPPSSSSSTTATGSPNSPRKSSLLSSPRRLSPSFPKSKSSSIHSKGVTSPGQPKSSTFSGIPRMSTSSHETAGNRRKTGSSPSGGFGKSWSQTAKAPPANNKNDSRKTPSTDLHSNGPSRLPVRKPLSPKPKTNPSKVSSVIHHENQSHSSSPTTGTHKILPNPTSATTTSITPTIKPLGKDEGYSTMSSEALAEQEASTTSQNVNPSSTLTKSNTFSTFHHNQQREATVGGSPSRRQLIMAQGERNWTSLPKNSVGAPSSVRIVRGIPQSFRIEDSEGGGETMTIEEPSSTSTILWEDSDDSDILFLPLEMSSGASSPTLVPPSWTSPSRLPSSTSFSNSSTATNGSSFAEHPLRRSKGEELSPWTVFKPEIEVQVEERALIEKWMKLEDFRNQVQWGDEWAWDWDGVARTYVKTPSSPAFKKWLPEFWTTFGEESLVADESAPNESKIDSSTWTKKNKTDFSTLEKEVGDEQSKIPSQTEEAENLVEKELIPNETTERAGGDEESSSPPPVIEFTPAFYHLVKYGSNSSVNDNSQLITSARSPTLATIKPKESEEGGRMDDKISQTDFGSCSSHENLSASTELFTECKNCLELIKRLVGGIDEACLEKKLAPGDMSLSREKDNRWQELETDKGARTTWISVPKGLPVTEVDRIFEILSSSESEDLLSPPNSKTEAQNPDFGSN